MSGLGGAALSASADQPLRRGLSPLVHIAEAVATHPSPCSVLWRVVGQNRHSSDHVWPAHAQGRVVLACLPDLELHLC